MKLEGFDFTELKGKISKINEGRNNIICLLAYGSMLTDSKNASDLDIIIVVNSFNPSLDNLFKLLSEEFEKLDFHVYLQKEIEQNLSFFTREYVLEYLAKGLCLCGENIFKDKFSEVTEIQYKRSIFIRSVEHVQMVRKVFFSGKHNDEYKLKYLKKYILRLSINILLFNKIMSHTECSKMSLPDVLGIMEKENYISRKYLNSDRIPDSLEDSYNLFCVISENLLNCRKYFDQEIDT